MKVLNFKETIQGWWIAIQFTEFRGWIKDIDPKTNLQKTRVDKFSGKIKKAWKPDYIVELVLFPKIDDLKQMQPFFNNHINTTHIFGEVTVSGFIRKIPVESRDRLTDSLQWEQARMAGKVTGLSGSSDKYRAELWENPAMEMGRKTILEKKYPKVYVKTKNGWIPNLITEFYQQQEQAKKVEQAVIAKVEKDLFYESLFNSEFREGLKNGTAFQVLRRWTVSGQEEIPSNEEKKEKEYTPVIIPAMNTSKEDGRNFRSDAGQFDYELISRVKSGGRAKTLGIKDYIWSK